MEKILRITQQLTVPAEAQPCIVQPSTPLALSGKNLSSVAFMVLILTVTQWTILTDISMCI